MGAERRRSRPEERIPLRNEAKRLGDYLKRDLLLKATDAVGLGIIYQNTLGQDNKRYLMIETSFGLDDAIVIHNYYIFRGGPSLHKRQIAQESTVKIQGTIKRKDNPKFSVTTYADGEVMLSAAVEDEKDYTISSYDFDTPRDFFRALKDERVVTVFKLFGINENLLIYPEV